MTLTTDTLARIAYEAAAASLMETRDWEEAPTWETAERWYPGTFTAYLAAVTAVVEAIAQEAVAESWVTFAELLRAIIATEPRKVVDV